MAWTGPVNDLPAQYGRAELHEFGDCVVVPGLVDAHAHPLFAGDREPDFAARLRGEKPPLGMLHTVERTRKALEHPERFWNALEPRLRAIAAHGTTTLETKTGYALHKPGEMELLDLIHAHRDEDGLPISFRRFWALMRFRPSFQMKQTTSIT